MNIEIVTDTFPPDVNGVAMTLGRLCTGLRAAGHRVRIFRSGPARGTGETSSPSMPLPGYREVRIGFPKPIALKSRWERRRPDVVYIATQSPLGMSALGVAKSMAIPVATGFHTNFQDYAEKYRLGPLHAVAATYLRGFHNRADLTLVPSFDQRQRLVAQGFESVEILGRGVDTERFSPHHRCHDLRCQWGASPTTPVVIVVGRVAPEKNFELTIRTFARLRQCIPDAVCVVVGDGPLLARLRAQHPWIHFCGTQTDADLAKHYASADVLLFPSETETFGNVLLEGLASGLATVSYDYAAAATHVQHGANGYKAAKHDADAFMSLAVRASTHKPGDPLRSAARESALNCRWDHIIRDFELHLTHLANAATSAIPGCRPAHKPERFSCRTVFLSDLHLGTPDSKAHEVAEFLNHIKCRTLVLNGDIIDGWALKRGSRWKSRHSRVVRRILKMTERDGTEVIYLRGNHDEILQRFMPLHFGKIRLQKEYLHQTEDGKSYLVLHGDGFDSVTTHHRWLAVAGAIGYDFLLKINRIHHLWNTWRGKETVSLSKLIKAKVKSAVGFVDRYEQLLQQLARHRNCDGIICGHIHTPEDKHIHNVHYLNSGDWVESLTAIIEHHGGRLELVRFDEFMRKLAATAAIQHTRRAENMAIRRN